MSFAKPSITVMHCPNGECRVESAQVSKLGEDEWRVGNYHIAATVPCCPACGADLTPRPPTIVDDYNVLKFLNSLG